MKNLSRFLLAVLLAAVAAFQPAIAQGSAQPATTFASLQAAKSAAWKEYTRTKSAAWKQYTADKTAAYKAYRVLEAQELQKLRSSTYDQYLSWIDAEKIGDFDKVRKLEKTVPAIAAYKKVTDAKFAEYDAADKKSFKAYEAADTAAFKVYEAAEAAASATFSAKAK